MLDTLTPTTLHVPMDLNLPGLRHAAPDLMLKLLRQQLQDVPVAIRDRWTLCTAREAIYQPGRSCRIAYSIETGDPEETENLYVRWSTRSMAHASAVRITAGDAAFEVFRYPRDRKMRQIRSMRRSAWLREASQQWFEKWIGKGQFAPQGWRCTPIKYVPESRLVCRLKGLWINSAAERWVRAYVRMARRNDAESQHEALLGITRSFDQHNTTLSVPRPLGCIPSRHLLATEFVRGQTLTEFARPDEQEQFCSYVRRLAAMGRCFPQLPEGASPLSGSAAPRTMLADLRAVLPDTLSIHDALVDWSNRVPAEPPTRVLVHGDLHSRQVIIKAERVCLVDWEQACMGDGTCDITNLASEFASEGELDIAGHCTESWRSAGGVWNGDAARWWAVRALILRAWGLLRHLRPEWPRRTQELLKLAVLTWRDGAEWL